MLQFFFVYASVVSYVAFVLSLFVPHPSFYWCHGRVALRDCGISLVPSLIFLYNFVSLVQFLYYWHLFSIRHYTVPSFYKSDHLKCTKLVDIKNIYSKLKHTYKQTEQVIYIHCLLFIYLEGIT